MKFSFQNLWKAIVELLFPRRCPVCDGIVQPRGELICPECAKKLRPIEAPWCAICGRNLARGGELCEDCGKGKMHAFRRARALYEYRSVRSSIYRFKYGGRREYKDFFGEQMAKYLGSFIRSVSPDGIVPVPLHPKRLRKRGYNQAKELADVLGAHLGLPVYDKILSRVKYTAPLRRQISKERQNNLKKAFLVKQNDVKLKTIILIDDIYTTGATVDEAAMALREGGAENVYVVTLSVG